MTNGVDGNRVDPPLADKVPEDLWPSELATVPAETRRPLTDDPSEAESEAVSGRAVDIGRLIERSERRILDALERLAATETFQQDLITRMHNDLQDQANQAALQPVVAAMIRLHEQAEQQVARLQDAAANLSPGDVIRHLDEFSEDLGRLLEQAGVVRFEDKARGEHFNASRQQILGRKPTDDATLNLTISKRVRRGADFGKTLLRREGVEIYVHNPDLPRNELPPAPSRQPASGSSGHE